MNKMIAKAFQGDIALMENSLLKAMVTVSVVIILALLIPLARWGIDLKSVFFGTPWNSHLEQTRGIEAVEGAVVFVTLIFGSLFIFGILALVKGRSNHKQPAQTTEGEAKPETKTE